MDENAGRQPEILPWENLAHGEESPGALSIGQMGSWELVLDTLVVNPSQATEQLCGFIPRPERPLSSYLRLIHREDFHLVKHILNKPPIQFRIELRIYPRGQKEVIWLAIHGELRQDQDGRVRRLTGAVSDISPVSQTERLLQKQTSELEARVRQLNCLYAVSRLVQQQHQLDHLLEQVVQVIPSGFWDSDNLGVRLTWSGKSFQTSSFVPGSSHFSHELKAQGQVIGWLEIQRNGVEGFGQFPPAEQSLMRALTKPISRAIERKQVLEALSESEDRWRTLASALAEGLVLYDQQSRIQAWNGSAERLLGVSLSRGQAMGVIQDRSIHEDGTHFSISEYPANITLATGRACDDVVMGIRRKEGDVSWLSISSRPLFHADEDEAYAVVVSFADITERKLAEEAIQREIEAKEFERNRLNTVLEALPVAVYIADADGKLQQGNAAAKQMWGTTTLNAALETAKDARGSHSLAKNRLVQTHSWGLTRAIEEGESVIAEEMEIDRLDGTRLTVLNYALPFHKPDGAISGGVGVSVDITDLKRSEGERALLAAIVKASPDAIASTDMEGRITSWNTGAERMYGYSAEEILDKSISVLMPPECQDELEMILASIAEGKGVTYFDSTRLHKSGKRVAISVAVTPITDAAGRVTGAAKIDRDITDRKLMEQQLQHDALHDRLTGVANRSLFMDRLNHVIARAERFGERYAVFLLDMDNFKLINDSFGHHIGDRLLCAFVERIQELLRPVDTLARFGGDEFTLMLEEIEDQASAEQVAQRIVEALREPFRLEGQEVSVSSSIGIMLGDPACQSGDQALRNADVALYEAKRQGKNQFVVFDARMRGEEASRLYLESELRRALQAADLTVQYQPIVDLQSNRAVGCEALARWKHPVMGRVEPIRFINVAEETGLITPLGRFVLERACARLAAWLRQPGFPVDFYVSVNVSPKEFYSGDLVPFVKAMLNRHELGGVNIRLEITENVIIQHDQEAAVILGALKDLGVKTCLDDFGTGYSSLSYLHQLPFDIIKVDQSFIQRLPDNKQSREIVRSILGLAIALDMQAVAEGVESHEQLAQVHSLGFRWAQGYVLHRPMDSAAIANLFDSTE